MPKFVIEREIPTVGSLNSIQLQGVAQKSCEAFRKLGAQIQWVQSYITGDKTYCVYAAPNKEIIAEHAKAAGIPANRISEVRRIIDDNTAVV